MSAKLTPKLITQRQMAKLISIDTATLRGWVQKGEWPQPHSVVEQTWFFRAADFEYFLAEGVWPEGVRFNRPARRPRYP
jgi:hypothetical protein